MVQTEPQNSSTQTAVPHTTFPSVIPGGCASYLRKRCHVRGIRITRITRKFMRGNGRDTKRPAGTNGMTGLTSHICACGLEIAFQHGVGRAQTAADRRRLSLRHGAGAGKGPLLSAVTQVLPQASQPQDELAPVSCSSSAG